MKGFVKFDATSKTKLSIYTLNRSKSMRIVKMSMSEEFVYSTVVPEFLLLNKLPMSTGALYSIPDSLVQSSPLNNFAASPNKPLPNSRPDTKVKMLSAEIRSDVHLKTFGCRVVA